MARDPHWYDRLEAEARNTLSEHARRYFFGTAGAGEVAEDGADEWSRIRFVPRTFGGGGGTPDTATTVLGTPVATPVLVAPMAQQNAAHPRAERETAAGARAAGTLLGISTMTSVPFGEIAATGAPWWFQLYVMRDEAVTWSLVDGAVAAGASAIVLTVDFPELDDSDGPVDPTTWPLDYPERLRMVNAPGGAAAADLVGAIDPTFIDALARRTGLDIVVKGIVHPDDARVAVDAGASAVVVSTHGSRRLGRSISSLRALPGVVAAVGDDAEVYLDSGVRSGLDVAAALALGARAVFVGRPAMWGLATDGERGVRRVVDQLTGELADTIGRLGVGGVRDLTPDMVWGNPTL